MRVAVVGGGITGLTAAFELAKAGAEVVIYEKEDYLGGHARTVTVDNIDLDIGFMIFNRVTYPNMMEMFDKLGVGMEVSDMSFSVSLDEGKGCEWGSRNGLASLFAQKFNLINPSFWRMLREILKFKDDALRYLLEHEENSDMARNETLEDFIKVQWILGDVSESLSCSNLCFVMVVSYKQNNELLFLLGAVVLPQSSPSTGSISTINDLAFRVVELEGHGN